MCKPHLLETSTFIMRGQTRAACRTESSQPAGCSPSNRATNLVLSHKANLITGLENLLTGSYLLSGFQQDRETQLAS